jgi:DNA-binding NtrC family response regulator
LRERRSDIPILSAFFLERLAPGRGVQVSGNAMKALLAYDWPGNVRELENCLERAVALGDQRIIEVNDLPPAIACARSPSRRLDSLDSQEFVAPTTTDLEDIERATIERVFPRSRETKPGRKNAGHQPRHPLSQTEALQHRHREEPPQSTTLQ